jgi:hypothetical protein
MMGVPISKAFVKPIITPEEKVFHPKLTMAIITMITKRNVSRLIRSVIVL